MDHEFRLSPWQRLLDWRRSCGQLGSLLRNGMISYRLAKSAIHDKQCLQRKWELIELIGMVRRLQPKIILEIGTYQGGTLYCWAQVTAPEAWFVCVDLFEGDGAAPHEQRFRSYLLPGQTLDWLRMDSHAPATRDRIQSLLGGQSVDFLFIDGDHSYAGVKVDFELYAPLVRSGGLIGFHDVNSKQQAHIQVPQFWEEVKASYKHYEFIDRDGFETWGGIGVLKQP